MRDDAGVVDGQWALRWGIFLVLGATLAVSVVPSAVSGFTVSLGGERARVASFAAWSLPRLDVAFSSPPTSGQSAMYAWAVDQLADAIFALAVLVYYGGLLLLGAGLLLLGVAVVRFYRSAEALSR